MAKLQQIADQAARNGVNDLYRISGAQARELEPALLCDAALVSPSTGIVDSHALMLALQGDAENHGAQCVFHTAFSRGRILDSGAFHKSKERRVGEECVSTCRSRVSP